MPFEFVAYSDEMLKGLITGIFAMFLLVLFFGWFVDFLMKASSGDI